jgi:hypothetical protein
MQYRVAAGLGHLICLVLGVLYTAADYLTMERGQQNLVPFFACGILHTIDERVA